MDDYLLFFLALPVFLFLVSKYEPRDRSEARSEMELCFLEHEFEVGEARIPGARLILIHKQLVPRQWGLFIDDNSGTGPTWYCMGPGPTYLIITAHFAREWHADVRVEFAVGLPSADKFRQALRKQRAALRKVAAVEQAMAAAPVHVP